MGVYVSVVLVSIHLYSNSYSLLNDDGNQDFSISYIVCSQFLD